MYCQDDELHEELAYNDWELEDGGGRQDEYYTRVVGDDSEGQGQFQCISQLPISKLWRAFDENFNPLSPACEEPWQCARYVGPDTLPVGWGRVDGDVGTDLPAYRCDAPSFLVVAERGHDPAPWRIWRAGERVAVFSTAGRAIDFCDRHHDAPPEWWTTLKNPRAERDLPALMRQGEAIHDAYRRAFAPCLHKSPFSPFIEKGDAEAMADAKARWEANSDKAAALARRTQPHAGGVLSFKCGGVHLRTEGAEVPVGGYSRGPVERGDDTTPFATQAAAAQGEAYAPAHPSEFERAVKAPEPPAPPRAKRSLADQFAALQRDQVAGALAALSAPVAPKTPRK